MLTLNVVKIGVLFWLRVAAFDFLHPLNPFNQYLLVRICKHCYDKLMELDLEAHLIITIIDISLKNQQQVQFPPSSVVFQ